MVDSSFSQSNSEKSYDSNISIQSMRYLWIIERISSRCIFYHEFYEDQPMDGVLISGLLSAFNIFSEEGFSSEGINSIEMGDLKWVYANNTENNLLLVAAGAPSCNSAHLKSQLDVIENMFITQFCLTKEYWESWDGNVGLFKNFQEMANNLKNQWQQASEMMNIGMIFDLFGIFQEILMMLIKIIENNFTGFIYVDILKNLNLYKEKIEWWLKKEELYDRLRIIDLFLPQIDLNTNKIDFSATQGTKVLGLNPIGLDQNLLKPIFLIVIRHFKQVIKDSMDHFTWLNIILKYFRSFIFNKWEILEQFNLTKEILQILLD